MARKRPTSVVIDPIAMGITNKIAAGSISSGDNHFNGGLMLEGETSGTMEVNGILLIMAGAVLKGTVVVNGDAYIFGQVGTKEGDEAVLIVHGELHLTSKCVAYGKMKFKKLAHYQGAMIHGSIETLAEDQGSQA